MYRCFFILSVNLVLLTEFAFAAPKPHHHFTMDESVGTTITDSVGTKIGTLIGGTSLGSSAVLGKAIRFDGSNDLIALNASIFIEPHQDFTVTTWISPDVLRSGSNTNAAIPFGNLNGANYIRIQSSSVYLKWNNTTANLPLNPAFTTHNWQHFALRRENDQIIVFRNGEVCATGSLGTSFDINTFGAKNQGSAFANHLDGKLDDIRIYRGCALSDSDIISLSRHQDGRVLFSAMGCGPYNHPLGLDGYVEKDILLTTAWWDSIVDQYPHPTYLDRDDDSLWNYVARETMEYPPSEFLIHLGDLLTGRKKDWPDVRFQDIAELLGVDPVSGKALHRLPQFFSPGDNDWSDQNDVGAAYTYMTNHFGRFHEKFVDDADQLRFPHPVTYQHAHEDNFTFMIGSVQFLGLTVPGGGQSRISDWKKRIDTSSKWISRHLPPEPVTPDHLWNLNETIAGPVTDASGGNHGVNQGCTIDQPGRIETAYSLDGINDTIALNTAVTFATNENFTVCAWVYPDVLIPSGFETPSAVILGDTANNNFIRINTDAVATRANGSSWNISIPANAFTTGEWQHFALSRSGEKMTAYRNGVPLGSVQLHNKMFSLNRIGSKNNFQHYQGDLDHLMIFHDVALSEDELLALSFKQAHWRMDESAAGPVKDRLGNNDAVNNGATINQPGEIRTAYDFDGADDIQLTNPLSFEANEDFLIAVWVRPDVIIPNGPATPSAVLIGQDINDTYIRLAPDRIRFKANNNFYEMPTSPSFTTGTWQHFILSREGGLVTVYRNGNLVASAGGHAQPVTFNRIGSKNTAQYFDGRMDDLRVYAHGISKLSSSEKAQLLGNFPHATVILAQATITSTDYTTSKRYVFPLREPLIRGAQAYYDAFDTKRPILFLQADEHRWKEESNYLGEANIKRLVINSIDVDHPPTQVVVTQDTDPDDAFLFNRRGDYGADVKYLEFHEWANEMAGGWGYELWAAIQFGDPAQSNAQPKADPDSDTRTNYEEYLDGGDPLTADQNQTWVDIVKQDGTFDLQFKRRHQDIRVQLEKGTMLGNDWTPVNATPDIMSGDVWEFPNQPDTGLEFYRLVFTPYL